MKVSEKLPSAPSKSKARYSSPLNWAACGCKLWDFEIGYHSRNRVDPSSAQAYTWRQRPKNVNGR
ncbi:hypothetical protein, partial [Pseudomonas cannabina]|uniref:hypothetical protein n=1 Tax=Pseudomonas cannabina TaxID=86840 RepID=UPI001CC2EA1E